jgi:hypothetical protein
MQVENAKAHAGDTLIAMLGSPNPSEREAAVERIAAMRTKLTPRQIERLRDLMRRGKKTWRRRSSRIRYYAGQTLEKIGSPYADERILQEARRAEQDGKTLKKVTDPGWI